MDIVPIVFTNIPHSVLLPECCGLAAANEIFRVIEF